MNQFVIVENSQDALETFVRQNPYSTYPTQEQAQDRVDELFCVFCWYFWYLQNGAHTGFHTGFLGN